MSSSERAARILKSLKAEEWKALEGLERALMAYGTADSGMVSRRSRVPHERTIFALDRLGKKGLVAGRGANYTLTREAIETLALRDYVRKDLISALGAVIAKGKESDVYETFDDEGSLFALKFFKLGRTSFTRVRKKRFIERSDMKSWITVNYEAARREYGALKKLRGLGASFPKAVAFNRSTVLLEELSGVRLTQRPDLDDPRAILDLCLHAARKAFVDAGLVNGDLSEYNILTDGLRVWLIDWPQAVPFSHPNSADLLRHDVTAVVRFFRRAYGVAVDEEAALSYVRGRSSSLE